jgi:hypothetical protein
MEEKQSMVDYATNNTDNALINPDVGANKSGKEEDHEHSNIENLVEFDNKDLLDKIDNSELESNY